ncbi:MAG: hypothetical protein CSA49_05395 [Gammaproteobacteria bacterium]|nr:MAG: hypothetical protein CSA49_05395 [Gammaproteobacteria bacterium]
MKLFVKLMIFLVVLALAGPFILKGPDGKPLMSVKDLDLPSMAIPKGTPKQLTGKEQDAWIAWSKDEPSQPPKVYVIGPNSQPPKPQPGVFYRWKDSNGMWQFSTRPNRGTANIVIETDPNANILQSLSNDKINNLLGRAAVQKPALNSPGNKPETEKPDVPNIPLPTTIPITQVPELINQARAVQDLMNKRTEMLNNNQF